MSGRYSVIPEKMGEAVRKANSQMSVTTNLLTWCAVHGSLQMAMRHPDFPATTRAMLAVFVEQLGAALVESGFFTAETLQESIEREKVFHARKITQND